MSVEILTDGVRACFLCNTTDTAFGPVLMLPDTAKHLYDDVEDYMADMMGWMPGDAREYNDQELIGIAHKFEHHVSGLHECERCMDLVPKSITHCEECAQEDWT